MDFYWCMNLEAEFYCVFCEELD